jgi:hypothetical protein
MTVVIGVKGPLPGLGRRSERQQAPACIRAGRYGDEGEGQQCAESENSASTRLLLLLKRKTLPADTYAGATGAGFPKVGRLPAAGERIPRGAR